MLCSVLFCFVLFCTVLYCFCLYCSVLFFFCSVFAFFYSILSCCCFYYALFCSVFYYFFTLIRFRLFPKVERYVSPLNGKPPRGRGVIFVLLSSILYCVVLFCFCSVLFCFCFVLFCPVFCFYFYFYYILFYFLLLFHPNSFPSFPEGRTTVERRSNDGRAKMKQHSNVSQTTVIPDYKILIEYSTNTQQI